MRRKLTGSPFFTNEQLRSAGVEGARPYSLGVRPPNAREAPKRLPKDEPDAGELDAVMEGVRSRLGEEPFIRAQAVGREMAMEVALESALEWLEASASEARA